MVALNVSGADALLKRIFEGPVREILNSQVWALDNLLDSPHPYEGKGISWSINTARNPSTGARADGGTLMSAGSNAYSEAQISAKYGYTRGKITGPTLKLSKSNKGSFARALASEMKFSLRDMKKEVNFWSWGDGTGVRATCDSSVTSTTCEVKWAGQATPDVSAPGTRFIRKGMPVLVGTSGAIAGGSALARVVSSVTDGDTFEFTASTVQTSGDLIVEGDASGNSYNNVPMGLVGIVDDDTGTFQNISRSTVPEWKGSVLSNSGTLRSLTEDLIQRAMDKVQIRAGGQISKMVCDPNMRRQIVALGLGDKRYADRKIELGWEVINYAGGAGTVPVYVDVDAPYNKLFGFDTETVFKAVLEDFHFADDDGHVLRNVSGEDGWEYLLRWFGNFVSDNPAANFVIEDITCVGVESSV